MRRQVYNYSKGHVAYHLTTLLYDGDGRAVHRLLWELPKGHLARIRQRLRGRSVYPVRLVLLEILGNLAGPWCLWRSRVRVRREGRSAFPCVDRTEVSPAESNRPTAGEIGRDSLGSASVR